MINRLALSNIKKWMSTGKAIVILGARQTGKTTLLKKLSRNLENVLWLDCDDPVVRTNLENVSLQKLQQIIGKHCNMVIDEIQRVKNSGLTLKLITDHFPEVQLFVSGSSALDIAADIYEPLTGRKREMILYPICWQELKDFTGYLGASGQLEPRLIYGMYPEVIMKPGEEQEILKELISGYLYKDILSLAGIRKPDVLDRLLRAVAFQIGNEVSYSEIARVVEVDKKTVINYLDLLEKSFILFRLQPFARNLRNEISAKRKIYFYDTGIRNALLAAYQPLSLRADVGQLWENFIISERVKQLEYNRIWCNRFFWRTTLQQEIDYIEEKNGKYSLYEFKWNPKKSGRKFSRTFLNNYPVDHQEVITPDNMDKFLLE